MNIKQYFKAPTPKQFFYINAIYAIGAPILGVIIADPSSSAIMMLFLLISLVFTSAFLKNKLFGSYHNPMIGIPLLIVMLGVFIDFGVLSTKAVSDRSQLKQISGVVPDDSSKQRVAKVSSSALVIDGVWLHCSYKIYDSCDKIYNYSGQTAKVLYQDTRLANNIVYEIQVGDQQVYSFKAQQAALKDEQNKHRRQWFFSFLIFVLPIYWFYKNNKRLRNEIPEMSGKEELELRQQQQEAASEGGCATAIGVFMFFTIALCTGLTGIIYLAIPNFGIAAIWMLLSMLSSYIIVILSKPANKL